MNEELEEEAGDRDAWRQKLMKARILLCAVAPLVVLILN